METVIIGVCLILGIAYGDDAPPNRDVDAVFMLGIVCWTCFIGASCLAIGCILRESVHKLRIWWKHYKISRDVYRARQEQ